MEAASRKHPGRRGDEKFEPILGLNRALKKMNMREPERDPDRARTWVLSLSSRRRPGTSETVLEQLRRLGLDHDPLVPDMELNARTKVAGQISRAASNEQEYFSQTRMQYQFSHNLNTRVGRGENGEEKEQVAEGFGRYNIPQQTETATTPQMQRLTVDDSYDSMGQAIRLAMRNSSFRPADSQHFLRVVENLLPSLDEKSLSPSPSPSPSQPEEGKEEKKEEKKQQNGGTVSVSDLELQE